MDHHIGDVEIPLFRPHHLHRRHRFGQHQQYFEPLVDVVGSINNDTIKKINKYVSLPANDWLEIIHVNRHQEKA
jgi:hypothetical protein